MGLFVEAGRWFNYMYHNTLDQFTARALFCSHSIEQASSMMSSVLQYAVASLGGIMYWVHAWKCDNDYMCTGVNTKLMELYKL